MLLLGLSDSSLVLYDQRREVSLLASCPVPPTLLAWHPAGSVVMVGGGQAELMCFDVGLAPVNMALVAEEVASAATLRLAQHLRCSGGLEALQWGTGLEGGPEGTDMLMLTIHEGPLAALRFRLGRLSQSLYSYKIWEVLCCTFTVISVFLLPTAHSQILRLLVQMTCFI